ncbi:MAG TPA: HAD family phosphatase [Bryobacteraceae bacterium]|nr:HAD family phosphatase [Bryobacteraceae bacterium]
MSWDAILFDFDGVLADTEPVHWRCWNDILEPFSIQLTWEAFERECIGVSDRALIERLASQRQPPIPFDELWSQYPCKKELFRRRLAEAPPFVAETVALVRELSEFYKLAVVTSSARIEVEPALLHGGIRACFQELVCGKEVENLKPAPDPYLKAAELLGARKPLVIEDSDSGVASARAAGFEVLRISDVQDVARAVREFLSY